MNTKELKEIKKRFSLDKNSISHIYGCYVNVSKEIVTTINMPLGLMEQEEVEMYMKILKKAISGNIGKNLLELSFSTEQVEDSDEHRLLQSLVQSELSDENLRGILYQKIIDNLNMEDESYVILLAADAYDVPFKAGDGKTIEDASTDVFDYFVCAVCPVKDAKATLRYTSTDKAFRNTSTGHVLGTPVLGFMFPTFDDRMANIYNVLYYSKGLSNIHDELISGLFNIENVPMASEIQKNAFSTILSESLREECSLEVVQAVHSEVREILETHKDSGSEESTPEIYLSDIKTILKKNNVSDEKITTFAESYEEVFGEKAVLNPDNLINTKFFELTTAESSIKVEPESAESIQTKIIDGIKYVLIPVGSGMEVNGINISSRLCE